MPLIPSSNIQALHLGETRRHPLPGPVLSTCRSRNTRDSGRRSFPAPTLSQTTSPMKCKLPEREPEIDARFHPLFSVPPPALKCLLGTKGQEQRTITSVFPTSGENADLGAELTSALGPDAAPQLRKQLPLDHFSEIISQSAAPRLLALFPPREPSPLSLLSSGSGLLLCLRFVSLHGLGPRFRSSLEGTSPPIPPLPSGDWDRGWHAREHGGKSTRFGVPGPEFQPWLGHRLCDPERLYLPGNTESRMLDLASGPQSLPL